MIVVLVSLVIVLTLCCIIKYSHPELELIDTMKPPISVKSMKGRFRTGDLLFMPCADSSHDVIKALSNTSLSHCGMVIVPPEDRYGKMEPLLWECDVGQRYRDGPRVVPLMEKLEHYDLGKQQLMVFLPIRNEIEFDPLIEYILKAMKDLEFDHSLISYILPFLFPSNKVYCSTLLARTLNTMGVERLRENMLSPGDLLTSVTAYDPYMLLRMENEQKLPPR